MSSSREEREAREVGKAGMESWSRLNEGLVAGIHHALNNRMAALKAVGQVVETDLSPGHPLAGALEKELERLEETAGLLRLLARGEEGYQPLQVEEVVADAARLFEMHHSLRNLQLETATPSGLMPVLAHPERLLRGVLVMLGIAARDARTVRLEAQGDERTVRLIVTADGNAAMDEGDEELRTLSASGAEQILRQAGANLTADTSGPARLEAVLLTLPEARRMERER